MSVKLWKLENPERWLRPRLDNYNFWAHKLPYNPANASEIGEWCEYIPRDGGADSCITWEGFIGLSRTLHVREEFTLEEKESLVPILDAMIRACDMIGES